MSWIRARKNGRQPEVEFFFVGLLLRSPKVENSCVGVWWLVTVSVSNCAKEKTCNFRLPFVALDHLYSSKVP